MKKLRNQKPNKEDHLIGSPPAKKRRARYVWLHVLPHDLWLRVWQGETVWQALQNTDVEVGGECGGLGNCGKCKVKLLSAVGPPSEEEKAFLNEKELKQGIRLACRTTVKEDLAISARETGSGAEYVQILTTSHHLKTSRQPILHLEPLVYKRLVALPSDLQDEGLSDLDRIKLTMGLEYRDLTAPLHCLRTLPEMLQRTQFHGAAVLHDKRLVAWQHREASQRNYGLVFDLGTSTLVGKLINLMDGSEAAVVSCLNSQSKYGTNVISRLQYIKEHPNGVETMHNTLIEDLNQITARLLQGAGLNPDDIFVAVAAGNTTMQHFLLMLDPSGIAEAPFSPVVTDGLIVKARDIGLTIHSEAQFYVMPAKSGYIGGDLISDVLASGAWERDDQIILGLDLGTNGEIFLGNHKRLMTCSAAAGPALEGARISYGMIAKTGAIGGVSFEEGKLDYQVIGNVKPKGICGSGLVDLVAMLLQLGIIDCEGLIRPSHESLAQDLSSRVINRSGICDFLVASTEESYQRRRIYLTQKDVRELQLAKAAIAAGIRTLMDEMGIRAEDIDHVYLAGALGNYVNPDSAMRIGLIPRFDQDIVTSLGNAASTGATMVLLSRNHWQMAGELAHSIEHVELSYRLDFNQYFIEHMDFPRNHTP